MAGAGGPYAVTREGNAPVMDVMYALGLAAHPDHMTFKEAAAVKSSQLTSAFRNNLEVTHFEELQYFTGLTSIPQSFLHSCWNLLRVVLPEQVTLISYNAFADMNKIESIELPPNIKQIYGYAFANTRFTNQPDGTLTVPEGCYELGNPWVLNTNLTKIVLPRTVKVVRTIGRQNAMPFFVTIAATTPPEYNGNETSYLKNLQGVYVPDESVDAYKAASGWDSVADVIFPMSDLGGVKFRHAVVRSLSATERRAA